MQRILKNHDPYFFKNFTPIRPYPLNIPSPFGVLMAVWQGNSKRSITGRRIRYSQNKRRFEIGREAHLTTIGTMKRKPLLMQQSAYLVVAETNPRDLGQMLGQSGCRPGRKTIPELQRIGLHCLSHLP